MAGKCSEFAESDYLRYRDTSARAAVEELRSLQDAMKEAGQDYWARLADGHILTVQAWIELSNGNAGNALGKQREAAQIEDTPGKSPVTPGHVLPARELLGDMLSILGRADEAKDAYRTTLSNSPNRAHSRAFLD